MSDINITTVRDMIDSSFNGEDTNTVNFTMIQNILYILAKQLKILQRQVSIEYSRRLQFRETEINITEMKVHSRGGKGPASKANQGAKGGPGNQSGGGSGGKEGQGDKLGKGGKGVPGGKEDKAGGTKSRQTTAESKESHDAKGQPESPESKKKQSRQSKAGEGGEEEGRLAKDAKGSDKYLKGQATDTSASDDTSTSKAADRKSQGKGGDRKGGKKGDDDDGVVHEKLLVVSRTSLSSGSARGTVATFDQFRNMVTQIRELQAKYGLEDSLDDEKLRSALHRETSLSHPIAAVNMSSRLQAAEKILAAIMPIVTDLAQKTPGIDLEAADDIFLKPPMSSASKTRVAGTQSNAELQPEATQKRPPSGHKQETNVEPSEMDVAATNENIAMLDPNFKGVTRDEMNDGLEEIYKAVMKNVTGASQTNYTAADGAMKRTQRVDARLDQAMKLGDIFTKLDTSVEDYTERINDLDGRLTAQMTNYQDELMQMQHNLESGLDTMAEVLAAPTEDAAAIAELNGYFTSFQLDIERTLERQQDLRKLQMEYSENELKEKINELQIRKCTRDEVSDALSDKAGIAALNGLVTMEQYQAVRGDFEKRIGHAYDKFNTKEITWQKAIDDLVRELNEKTDFNQLAYLNKEIQKHLSLMRGCLDEMLQVVGDIDPITTNRKIERYDNCLSCGCQYDAGKNEDHLGSRPPVIGAESAAEKEDLTEKYFRKCYPGYPVTHPIDPRSLTCHRYCGAADPSDRESAFKMHISKMDPNQGTTEGADGKVYLTDDHKKPCFPCNIPPKQNRISGSPSDSIRFNRLVSDPIENLFEGETATEEKGIIE